MANYDLSVKIILLGDFSVKKGTILRALQALPDDETEVTYLGREPFGMVEMLFVRNGKRIRVKISETAGQERFRSITSSFYRGVQGCLLLFDVTKRSTFESIKEWRQELHSHTIMEDMIVALAGCNCHVAGNERQVTMRMAQEYADHCGIPYKELSVQMVATLVHTLEELLDRIVVRFSRSPFLSNSIKPLDRKLEEIHQLEKLNKTKCFYC